MAAYRGQLKSVSAFMDNMKQLAQSDGKTYNKSVMTFCLRFGVWGTKWTVRFTKDKIVYCSELPDHLDAGQPLSFISFLSSR